jgi:enoyl-CoA hydratase/carnithine racemase
MSADDWPAASSPPAFRGKFMTGHLIVSDEEATRVITLRRPEKKNAITQDMYRAMSDAIDKAQNNPDIRCIIITGGSGVFTARKAICSANGCAPRKRWRRSRRSLHGRRG